MTKAEYRNLARSLHGAAKLFRACSPSGLEEIAQFDKELSVRLRTARVAVRCMEQYLDGRNTES